MKRVAIFCVNYNTYDRLLLYCRSVDRAALCAKDSALVHLFITDNTRPSPLPFNFTPTNISLRLASGGKNLGYLGGIQYMMRLTPDLSSYDYIILSNVDLTLEPDALLRLVASPVDPTVGWIAPSIISGLSGTDRNPALLQRYSKARLRTLLFMFSVPPLMTLYKRTLYRRHYRPRPSYPAGTAVYAGHGSFMILTRAYLSLCGIPNFTPFLFCEELYFAELCRQAGLKVVYRPDIRINDQEHASVGRLPRASLYRYNRQALRFILRSFYSCPPSLP